MNAGPSAGAVKLSAVWTGNRVAATLQIIGQVDESYIGERNSMVTMYERQLVDCALVPESICICDLK